MSDIVIATALGAAVVFLAAVSASTLLFLALALGPIGCVAFGLFLIVSYLVGRLVLEHSE